MRKHWAKLLSALMLTIIGRIGILPSDRGRLLKQSSSLPESKPDRCFWGFRSLRNLIQIKLICDLCHTPEKRWRNA